MTAPHLQMIKGNVRTVPYADRLRFFAGCCGTHLFFRETEGSEIIDITIASLDDPAPFGPQKAIWTEDRLPWVHLDPRLPACKRSSGEKT